MAVIIIDGSVYQIDEKYLPSDVLKKAERLITKMELAKLKGVTRQAVQSQVDPADVVTLPYSITGYVPQAKYEQLSIGEKGGKYKKRPSKRAKRKP